MLVLGRRQREGITCTTASGDVIHVEILAVRKNGEVKVGITASKSVEILRDELIGGHVKLPDLGSPDGYDYA